jgi:hypothetical protein
MRPQGKIVPVWLTPLMFVRLLLEVQLYYSATTGALSSAHILAQVLLSRPYSFNSFFSSFKKRQSVPWTMILCGVLLIIRASCSRSA